MIHVMHTPCHTKGHVAYVLLDAEDEKQAGLLFPGDTLFVGGCGRFFEGSASDMLHNMNRFAQLHPQTAIFCAHEYTESNYKFLVSVDKALCSGRYEEVLHLRKQAIPEPTVPSTIAQELETNLFMRCHEKKLQLAMGAVDDPVKTMAMLRGRKNVFKD
jgi:hydroxyacylglutathione hydrolase